jgi:hypothetical protein
LTKPDAAKSPQMPPLLVKVKGKVLRSRFYDQNYLTAIICPAVDEYSRPSVVQVRSKQRFAELEQQVEVNCLLSGYEGKAYNVVNQETGERQRITPVNLTLDLVES